MIVLTKFASIWVKPNKIDRNGPVPRIVKIDERCSLLLTAKQRSAFTKVPLIESIIARPVEAALTRTPLLVNKGTRAHDKQGLSESFFGTNTGGVTSISSLSTDLTIATESLLINMLVTIDGAMVVSVTSGIPGSCKNEISTIAPKYPLSFTARVTSIVEPLYLCFEITVPSKPQILIYRLYGKVVKKSI